MAVASTAIPDRSKHLGRQLRQRRRELGLTLKEVARGAGLSVGFISQIERGIATPSLSSLVAVSHALQTEVAGFLSQPVAETALSRHDQRAVYTISENSLAYERVSSSFPGSTLRSVIIHEPPGHRGEPIAHEGEEMMFVLKGAITVELEGERSVLEESDSIHFRSSRTHATWNHTDAPAAVLWVGTMDVFGEGPEAGLRGLHSPAGEASNASETENKKGDSR